MGHGDLKPTTLSRSVLRSVSFLVRFRPSLVALCQPRGGFCETVGRSTQRAIRNSRKETYDAKHP
jgi:hypothetical protein